jgi:3-oxosteroid 1-dehydrogenase
LSAQLVPLHHSDSGIGVYNLFQIAWIDRSDDVPAGRVMTGTVVDVVVVGTGGAGMTAALTAARLGLDVVVLEKSEHFGGSTARSGGGVWIPGNEVLEHDGVADDPGSAAQYLAHIVGPDGDPALQEAFLRHGPEMLAMVLEACPLQLRWVRGYSDYYPEAPGGRPGGRSVEPRPTDARILGADRSLLQPPYLASRSGLSITQADFRWLNLIARHPRGLTRAVRVGTRSWLARLRGVELLTMGQALAAGLFAGLRRQGVPVRFGTPLVGLVTDDDGRVTGVRVRSAGAGAGAGGDGADGADGGAEEVITARRGVVLAAGGFEQDEALRQEFQRAPIGTAWTVGAAENTGDAIRLGRELGAALELMDDAWWGPAVPLPRGPYFLLAERSLPGCILVNGSGRRFVNEAAPYVDAVHAMYDAHTDDDPHVPSWLVFDQRYRDRYLFTAKGPRQPLPGRWYRDGIAAKASTIEKLAAEIGVPGDTLRETVTRFNEMAERGRDEDFRRGESAYDRYYGDPRNRPNPNLAPLAKAPFHAVRIVPGDLGTKGGLRTDARARVLRPDGTAIPGLYAAGNTSALVMGRTYAGPGATLGPAMTFGYLAAKDLAAATAP